MISCTHEVLDTLGHGVLEKLCEHALVREFGLRDMPYRQQPRYPVTCKNCRVGAFVPDLIVFERVIVDTKAIDRIGDPEAGQMLNDLRITRLRRGLILHFRRPRLDCRRIAS